MTKTSELPLGTSNNMSWSTISSSVTIANRQGVFVNTSAGAYTVTLPANPDIGDIVAIVDGAGNASSNNITINRNGKLIEGASSNKVIDDDHGAMVLTYSGSTAGWVQTPDVSSGGSGSTIAGTLYVTYGYDTTQSTRVVSYDFSSWTTETSVGTARSGRGGGTRGYYVMAIAGYTSSSSYTDNNEYDGSTWYTRTVLPSPAREYLAGDVILGTHYAIYGYSRSSSSYIQDCDAYDGYAWTSKTDGPTPARNRLGSFEFNSKVYAVGGWAGSYLQDCDEFDGSSWTSKTDLPSPARRDVAADAINTTGYIAYGQGSSGVLSDTDSFDGSSWSSETDGPTPSRTESMAGNAASKLMCCGGYNGSTTIADVDGFNGSTWSSYTSLSTAGRASLAVGAL